MYRVLSTQLSMREMLHVCSSHIKHPPGSAAYRLLSERILEVLVACLAFTRRVRAWPDNGR